MANTIDSNVIAKILVREYERPITREFKVIPFANRKYEGDLKQKWDTVRVPFIKLKSGWNTSVTDSIRDIPASDLEIGEHSMVIEQYYDIRFKISDKQLSELGEDLWTTTEVVRQIKNLAQEKQEDYFVNKVITTTEIPTENKITWITWGLNGANIFAEIMKISTALSKQNVPERDRIIFINAETASILIQAKILDNTDVWLKARSEGVLWKIAWMTIVQSNAIPDNKIIGYQDKAANFVEKLNFIKVKEADSGNYYNIIGWLLFDAWLFWEAVKKVVIYTITP